MGLAKDILSQYKTLPYPTKPFTNQTIVITGSNIGLGLEATRHFARLEAAKIILAVRSIEKGEAAKASIEERTARKGVCEVWEVDLSSYESVKRFGHRLETLDRLDVFVANAGINTRKWTVVEGMESQIVVNCISPLLMGIMVLPKLRESAVRNGTAGVLTYTGSFVHWLTAFPERKFERLFEGLAEKERARMTDRYNVSKMVEMLAVRELAEQVTRSGKEGRVVVSQSNPGWVATNISASEPFPWFVRALKKVMARDTEMGSRTIVNAAEGGEETHGKYLSDCAPDVINPFVTSEDGAQAQKKVWSELCQLLETIEPGVTSNI
ncbi:Retinol dehydrogenase 12 [Cyphellophora attinorum]|uniref:Retinol dehydrogenase 12 n=1 Tax=Cyphellophora attinorum TaxID=1664694 RepID=A0A0N1GZ39_9EURO|nr:Retinol dehydrogenase 12 [Phialophora attinorum]KPI36277.1 Retinol dehydrogenase 12 [Phialophora attinorum]